MGANEDKIVFGSLSHLRSTSRRNFEYTPARQCFNEVTL